jgi:leader peptidase (prepilin peptidase)/N-methyltransferase
MTTQATSGCAPAALPPSGADNRTRAHASPRVAEPTDLVNASAPSASRAVIPLGGLVLLLGLMVALSVSRADGVPIAAGLVGALVVGPTAAHVVAWWIGWRVVVPLFVGCVPPTAAMSGARARCTDCGGPLSPGRLPAIAWTAAAGRCRGCGACIPAWVGAVEWSMGALFGLSAARFGLSWSLWPVLAFSAGAVVIGAVDLRCRRIPTLVVEYTVALCGCWIIAGSIALDQPAAVTGAAIGAVVAGTLLVVLHVLSPTGLGMGDVRFASLVGLIAGWSGWAPGDAVAGPAAAALAAVFVAALVALVGHGVVALRRGHCTPLPFAPALAVGGLLVVWSAA